ADGRDGATGCSDEQGREPAEECRPPYRARDVAGWQFGERGLHVGVGGGEHGPGQEQRDDGEHRSREPADPLPRRPSDHEYTFQLTKRSEEHTSELQSRENLVCRLLLEKKKEEGKPAE